MRAEKERMTTYSHDQAQRHAAAEIQLLKEESKTKTALHDQHVRAIEAARMEALTVGVRGPYAKLPKEMYLKKCNVGAMG